MRPLFTLPFPDDVITALNKSGIMFFEDLICEKCNDKVLEIIKSHGLCWNVVEAYRAGAGSLSAAQLLRKEQLNEYIPTFSEAVDMILGGGVQTDSILQVSGPPSSGKTQLGLQLCVNVQIPVSIGGLNAESVFIDTEGTFFPPRLKEIAAAASNHCRNIAKTHHIQDDVKNFTLEYILSRVHYVGVGNLTQLISSIRRLQGLLQQNSNIKLIVIDSITYPFLKITNTLDRTRHLSIILQDLQLLSTTFNLAIVINNHLTTKITQENKILAPALGESFTHLISNTLFLGIVDNHCSAIMYKSCKSKEEIVHFKVTAEGIRDV